MKMETPLHQLDEQTRRAKELRWMDERAVGRTDVRIVWIHSRGVPAKRSPGRVHAQRRTNIDEKCAAMKNFTAHPGLSKVNPISHCILSLYPICQVLFCKKQIFYIKERRVVVMSLVSASYLWVTDSVAACWSYILCPRAHDMRMMSV